MPALIAYKTLEIFPQTNRKSFIRGHLGVTPVEVVGTVVLNLAAPQRVLSLVVEFRGTVTAFLKVPQQQGGVGQKREVRTLCEEAKLLLGEDGAERTGRGSEAGKGKSGLYRDGGNVKVGFGSGSYDSNTGGVLLPKGQHTFEFCLPIKDDHALATSFHGIHGHVRYYLRTTFRVASQQPPSPSSPYTKNGWAITMDQEVPMTRLTPSCLTDTPNPVDVTNEKDKGREKSPKRDKDHGGGANDKSDQASVSSTHSGSGGWSLRLPHATTSVFSSLSTSSLTSSSSSVSSSTSSLTSSSSSISGSSSKTPFLYRFSVAQTVIAPGDEITVDSHLHRLAFGTTIKSIEMGLYELVEYGDLLKASLSSSSNLSLPDTTSNIANTGDAGGDVIKSEEVIVHMRDVVTNMRDKDSWKRKTLRLRVPGSPAALLDSNTTGGSGRSSSQRARPSLETPLIRVKHELRIRISYGEGKTLDVSVPVTIHHIGKEAREKLKQLLSSSSSEKSV
ncbi:hypothetical protein HK102_013880 [Quaeritorhiza haematococci]|nr:hypothetical protein HK102_013880 [Quaeritorhiza haematococci]